MGLAPLQQGDFSSPNFSEANRQPGDVLGIIIHDTESTSAAALAWLTNPVSGVSAHYLISEDGGIYRLVHARRVAYHASAFGSDPTKNRNRPDWLPPYGGGFSSTNKHTIGIELAGFAAHGFRPIQYQALGLLCAQLCRDWGIPPTLLPEHGAAARITTHGYLQTDRTDPGPHFDWGLFKTHLLAYLGDDDMATVAELQGQIDQLNGQNTERQRQIDALRAEIDGLNGVNTEFQRMVDALREELAARQADVAALTQHVDDCIAGNRQLSAMFAEEQARTARLRDELTAALAAPAAVQRSVRRVTLDYSDGSQQHAEVKAA